MNKLGLVIIILFAFLIRIVGINQSIWLDEAISANVTSNYKLMEIPTKFSISDFHPPLYYMTLKVWTEGFGRSVVAMRMMSVFFSLVTIYFVYLIGGKGSAALVAFNPLLVYYSQEIRMYSMVTMLLTIGLYFYSRKKYLGTSILFGLSLLTFYGSIFLIVAVGIWELVNRRWMPVVKLAVFPILAMILLTPLLRLQMVMSQEMLVTVKNWSLVLGKANIKNLLLIPIKFTSGRISYYPKIIYFLISGAWAIIVFWQMRVKNKWNFIFWMTLLIGTMFSIFTPMLQYFRFLYLIPIMGLVIKNNRLIVAGFIMFALFYVLNSTQYREDWKSVANDIPEQVWMINSFADPIQYYRPDVKINDIRSEITGEEVMVIPYGEEIHGVDHNKILTDIGYKIKDKKSYRGLTTEVWIKE